MHVDSLFPPELAVLPMLVGAFLAVCVFFVDVLFAVGVTRDGDRIREKGGDTFLVGPTVWGLGVLVGSFLVVALYWLVHHSSLRASHDSAAR